MKKVGKILGGVLITFIVIVDVMLTVYLLNYNEYNVSVINNKSFIIMKEDVDQFKKNDLLVIAKPDSKKVKKGDEIFFYNDANHSSIINFGKVASVNEVKEGDNTYTMENHFLVGYKHLIGRGEDVKVYKDYGKILKTLSSKWIFLIFIIFPILVLFLYELVLLIEEIKKKES